MLAAARLCRTPKTRPPQRSRCAARDGARAEWVLVGAGCSERRAARKSARAERRATRAASGLTVPLTSDPVPLTVRPCRVRCAPFISRARLCRSPVTWRRGYFTLDRSGSSPYRRPEAAFRARCTRCINGGASLPFDAQRCRSGGRSFRERNARAACVTVLSSSSAGRATQG